MLQFTNSTSFQGMITLMPDPEGVDSIYSIVKGTFTLGENPVVADVQIPIRTQDLYLGTPGQSSIKEPSDVGLVKPGTDVLLTGTAYSPAGKTVRQLDVVLRVGPISKTLRVFGDRVWKAGMLRTRVSKPDPFETIPLIWERAFGGMDVIDDEPPALHSEHRNPVGTGFRVKNGRNKLDGLRLPNLENPQRLISSWNDRPVPFNFGPICPAWEPRRTYAGTYDGEWQKHRAPYLPTDFNPRFFHLAPPDQVVPTYLRGGEAVEIRGATPSSSLQFHLPNYHVQITYKLDNKAYICPANLETVLIQPDQSRLLLVWRSVFPCDKKALRVREVEAALAS